MIGFEPAGIGHFDELLAIIYHQEDACLKPILDHVQMTQDQFGRFFRTTGTVYRILAEDCLVGVCWVEVCDRVLQLHGLILKESFRGQGIGTQALNWLEMSFCGEIDAIELRVHVSNPRAKALYTRCGYETMDIEDQSGFYRMRKKIRESGLNSRQEVQTHSSAAIGNDFAPAGSGSRAESRTSPNSPNVSASVFDPIPRMTGRQGQKGAVTRPA